MTYVPQHMIDTYNNAITCIYVVAGILLAIAIMTLIATLYPEPMAKFSKWLKRVFNNEKVVTTVYSDKSKNYSGTEFLPVPVKAPTDSFSYEFLGWNKFAKDEKGNFVTQPIYLKKVKTCIVNVYDEKDNILETHEVEYGAGITIAHKIIKKQSTKEFEYEFVGWDKETKAFFENSEIRPVFKAKPIKFTYKFVLDDGTVVLEKKAICGTPINVPSDPAKVDDNYIFEFVGWKNYKRNMILDKDYVFEAEFEKKAARTQEEKLKRQKDAIEVVLNDYKPKKKKPEREDYTLQDSQNFASTKRVVIEKNTTKGEVKQTKKKSEPKTENSLLKGVIVEKNKTKKSKTS